MPNLTEQARVGFKPRWNVRRLEWGLLLLNAMVVGLIASLVVSARHAQLIDAESHAANLAIVAESVASAMFERGAAQLAATGRRLDRALARHEGASASLRDAVEREAQASGDVPPDGIFDAAGRPVCAVAHCDSAPVSAQDFFVHLRAHPQDPIALWGPYPGTAGGEPQLLLATALHGDRSEFAGVATVTIAVAPLRQLLASLDVGAHGAASLRSAGLSPLVSRVGPVESSSPAPAADAPALQRAIGASANAGLLWTTTGADGFDGVMAYRRLPGFAAYVVVGQTPADFLARWRRNSSVAALFAVLFAGVTWVVGRSAAAGLREQERAEQLYDEAPCGYHTVDARGIYLSINATELSWLGCRRDEVLHRLGPRDFLDPRERAAFDEAFPRLMRDGHLDNVEFNLIGRDGSRRQVLLNSRAVRDPHGAFVSSNTVMSDITVLHAARGLLEHREREQAAILDSELVGIAKLKDGRVVWANRGVERIFGYSQSEAQGFPIRMAYPDDRYFERSRSDRLTVMGDKRHYRVQRQMVRRDGTRVWIDINGTRMSDDPDDLMVLLSDITPLKEAEELRLRSVALDAQNAQLRETDRLKNQFLANMSHELRTPLNAIIGFADLLNSGAVDPGSTKFPLYLRQIGASGAHLLQLIESMLDFAKAESARIEFNPRRLNLGVEIDHVAAMLQAKCERQQVRIVVDVSRTLGEIEADPVRLRQVLLNFVGNAVKFSRVGGQVVVRAREAGADDVRVEVEDHGIGIDAADLPRLFTRFDQLSVGTSKHYEGTGLGLALVRRLIELQGGTVGVTSTLGTGSTFHFTLPRRASQGSA